MGLACLGALVTPVPRGLLVSPWTFKPSGSSMRSGQSYTRTQHTPQNLNTPSMWLEWTSPLSCTTRACERPGEPSLPGCFGHSCALWKLGITHHSGPSNLQIKVSNVGRVRGTHRTEYNAIVCPAHGMSGLHLQPAQQQGEKTR